jgi:O-6-methylguanine DNA methyltransferase
MTHDPIDALLTDYFRPAPPAGALTRRILSRSRVQARHLDRLLDAFSIEASECGIAAVHPGPPATAPCAAARRLAAQAREELSEYLQGRRVFFSVPVDLSGCPAFQRRVLDETRRIPFGETLSYSEIARRIGHDRASRAVGTALGRNPVPLIVPCHRVLRGDGSLGGYGLGLPVKQHLLQMERTTPVLEGCTSTRILCRVGCPALRRARPDRRVVFASIADARSVGYRTCRVCRLEGAVGPA